MCAVLCNCGCRGASSLREAFGMSILEGMACGLPVISSAATGVAALIEDGRNGYIFNQPTELSMLLEKLRAPQRRTRLAPAPESRPKSIPGIKTVDVYESLCANIAVKKTRCLPNPDQSDTGSGSSKVA